MTRLILILSLACVACGMSALPSRPLPGVVSAPVPEFSTQELDAYGVFYVTAIQSLTVRQEPSIDGLEIDWLENGERVTIYACHWNEVDRVEWCDIGTGWVARRYLGE